MKTLLQSVLFLLTLSSVVRMQGVPIAPVTTAGVTAPTGWTLFRVSAADVAVMLPTMPVRVEWGDACGETGGSIYYAYAGEAVYEMRFFAKDKALGKTCPTTRTAFGQETLSGRLTELRDTKPAPLTETDGELGGRKAKILRWETADEIAIRWVIPDLGRDRWYELGLNYRIDIKPREKEFVGSLVFSPANGVEILRGSPSMPGDKDTDRQPTALAGLADLPMGFKSKPRPPYTDLAEKNRTQGTVVLQVVFLANGSVGNISVRSALPNGLTEQAIAAARRIVFMPARAGGVPVTIVRDVTYRFTIV